MKKIIELSENVKIKLSIRAAKEGQSLKRYIEWTLTQIALNNNDIKR